MTPALRCMSGVCWLGFHLFLVVASARGSTSASIVFVAFVCCALCGSAVGVVRACQGRENERSMLPAIIAFPAELILAAGCILLGGWMAFAGAMLAVSAVSDLYAFGELEGL